jgi:hypothetical protein
LLEKYERMKKEMNREIQVIKKLFNFMYYEGRSVKPVRRRVPEILTY